jgi:hypothetical protein
MRNTDTALHVLIRAVRDAATAARLLETVEVHPDLRRPEAQSVSRGEIAMALCLLLLDDLLGRVPDARAYVEDCRRAGRAFVFDHGALRTVDWERMGALPRGRAAVTRILEPLGYRLNAVYPLDRLGMTGRAYCHADLPEALPQFFVSELHPERFSAPFQAAVSRVVDASEDPLDLWSLRALIHLDSSHALPFQNAVRLLPVLLGAFARHHPVPRLSDYQALLRESPEMAWIATEGYAFNHATDRVADIDAVAAAQRSLGRPIKHEVEVSASGRVRQTAFRAALVEREFVADDGAIVRRQVPGSFHEIISRDRFTDERGVERLDLGFDSGNAQQIFRMTAAEPAAA